MTRFYFHAHDGAHTLLDDGGLDLPDQADALQTTPEPTQALQGPYRIRNWPQYEAGLKRRGDLTRWLDEAAIAEWQAPRRTTPGRENRRAARRDDNARRGLGPACFDGPVHGSPS
jgi:hypothetical protein